MTATFLLTDSDRQTGRLCARCGETLAPNKGPGRARKWCSEKCRKGSYGQPCMDCGARTSYGAESARVPEPRCDPCRLRCASDRRVERVMAMLDLRRTEGLGNIEIAARIGSTAATVATELKRLRALGWKFPAAAYKNAEARRVERPVADAKTVVLGRELAKRGITP